MTPEGPLPFLIRSAQLHDRQQLHQLVQQAGVFSPSEISCACELIDNALNHPGQGYELLVAREQDQVLGYTCYGPTTLTESTWDLYWIATALQARKRGIGSALLQATERDIYQRGGRRIRVETSSLTSYGSAQRLYQQHGYPEMGRIPDYYKPGDALILFCKSLSG